VSLGLIANTSCAKLDIYYPYFLLYFYYSKMGIFGQRLFCGFFTTIFCGFFTTVFAVTGENSLLT